LLHIQRDHGTSAAMLARTTNDGTRWLFPGGLPGRPARDALAAELPAAELTILLNLNINTANAWAIHAQHDWTTYLAARREFRERRSNPTATPCGT
jgi:8-oxo-dGTP pyrophosphatase MutT (NUDIX family)